MKQINETTFTSDNGLITFIHGDCMEFMAGCLENEFDLAVVDPPYGIGMDGGNVGYKGSNNFKKKNWDKEIPPQLYFDELFLKSKNQIIFGGNYFCLPPTRCYLVWDKGDGFYNRTYSECELAWTSFDLNTVKIKHDPLARGDYKGKIHPTQKPVTVYRWIFKNYAKPTDHILDTHGGSMSSAIAAHMEGLKMTIIELDREYFDKAINRFSIYERQQTINFE